MKTPPTEAATPAEELAAMYTEGAAPRAPAENGAAMRELVEEAFSVDDVIAEVAPPEETWRVEIGKHVFTGRVLTDASEKVRVERKAAEMARMLRSGDAHPAWQPYKDTDSDVLIFVAFLSATLTAPKWGELDLLKFAAKAGSAFTRLGLEASAASTAPVFRLEKERIDRAGEG